MTALRQAFWATSLGLIVVVAGFLLLGGVSPADAGLASGVVAALAALWVLHAVLERRAERDPRALLARERRGF